MIKTVAIFGGGSASFLAADVLSKSHKVVIYEKGKTIGRKFLVAGKGGFNLSHNLEWSELSKKYSPTDFMLPALQSFDVDALRKWYTDLGIPTFVGSSNRIFPEKGITPAQVLRKITGKLVSQNVIIKTNHEFIGFSSTGIPQVKASNKPENIKADFYIFAFGGASWKVTGSDGSWLNYFKNLGIKTTPFAASNAGIELNWPPSILGFHTGKPLKNISVTVNNIEQKGEALITPYGLEGNAIYPISSIVRAELNTHEIATVILDLKPSQTKDQLFDKIKNKNPKNFSIALKLDKIKLAVLKSHTSKEQFLDANKFVESVKGILLKVTSLRPIEESISTVGGINISELNHDFSLKKHSNMYCIGEMVNWDAPTGGFLLQGCFSMGFHAGKSILRLS